MLHTVRQIHLCMLVWILSNTPYVRSWNKRIQYQIVNAQGVLVTALAIDDQENTDRSIYLPNVEYEHLFSGLSTVHCGWFLWLVMSSFFSACRTIALSLGSSQRMTNLASSGCLPTSPAHLSAWPVLRWDKTVGFWRNAVVQPGGTSFTFISFNTKHSILP